MTVIIPKSLHMKTYVGFFLIIFFGIFSSAEFEEQSALTVLVEEKATAWIDEGFVKLNPEDQKQLMTEVQLLLVSLNGHAELLSLNPVFDINPIWQSLFLSTCQAASETDFRNSIRVTESTSATWTGASQENALLFKKTGNIKYATSALSNLIAEAHRIRGNGNLSAHLKLQKQFMEVKSELIADARKHGVYSSISNMMYNQESIFQKITIQVPAPSPSAVSTKTVTAPYDDKKTKNYSISTQKNEDTFSACLYAGFIIQGSVCKAPVELPAEDGLREFFLTNKFKCASSQVMCNPLIFGFESSCTDAKAEKDFRLCLNTAKPICIANSVSATLSCKEKTNNERYTESALSLVKAKPALLRKLVTNSLRLCDEKNMAHNKMIYRNGNGSPRKNSERIKNDILQTCLVARPQIISIMKKYESLSSGAVAKPSGSSEGVGSRK